MTEILPIKTDRCVIRLMEERDIEWYTKQIMEPFFGEFMDIDPREFEVDYISETLGKLVGWYSQDNSVNEFRCVVEHGDELVGGITMFKGRPQGAINLGYWVIPQHQGKGIALECVLATVKKLQDEDRGVDTVRLEIQQHNKKSIRLAKKAGFERVGVVRGNITDNIVFEYKLTRQ